MKKYKTKNTLTQQPILDEIYRAVEELYFVCRANSPHPKGDWAVDKNKINIVCDHLIDLIKQIKI